jgi:hypothetical protein
MPTINRKSEQIRTDYGSGKITSTITWEMPYADKSYFLANVLPPGYITTDTENDPWGVDLQSGWVTFSATYAQSIDPASAAQGIIERTWTMHSGEHSQFFTAHPNFRAMVDAGSLSAVNSNGDLVALSDPNGSKYADWPYRLIGVARAYQSALNDYYTGGSTKPPWIGFLPDRISLKINGNNAAYVLNPPGISSALLKIRDETVSLYMASTGEPTYFESLYILRKTEVVRKDSSLDAVSANTDRVFTPTGILNAEPTLSTFSLMSTSTISQYNWFKKAFGVEQLPGGQYQITTEYESVKAYLWIYYGDSI